MNLHHTPPLLLSIRPLAAALALLICGLTGATAAPSASVTGRTINVNPVSGNDSGQGAPTTSLKTLTKDWNSPSQATRSRSPPAATAAPFRPSAHTTACHPFLRRTLNIAGGQFRTRAGSPNDGPGSRFPAAASASARLPVRWRSSTGCGDRCSSMRALRRASPKVSVDPETGTVVWPGGADLAPDTLYERVRTGVWPDQDVAA